MSKCQLPEKLMSYVNDRYMVKAFVRIIHVKIRFLPIALHKADLPFKPRVRHPISYAACPKADIVRRAVIGGVWDFAAVRRFFAKRRLSTGSAASFKGARRNALKPRPMPFRALTEAYTDNFTCLHPKIEHEGIVRVCSYRKCRCNRCRDGAIANNEVVEQSVLTGQERRLALV